MSESCSFNPTRRRILGSAGALFAWSLMPRVASAAGARDGRFICIVLRGALDGLSAVAPVGDPQYVGLREAIALRMDGPEPALSLDGFFALHPAMPTFSRLYREGQALAVHAVATGYRDRSHFDGQDVLESGQPVPGLTQSGWLNRLMEILPKGDRVNPGRALAVGAIPPLVLRGPSPVLGWAPSQLPKADDDLARRVLQLYEERDQTLAAALNQGLKTRDLAGAAPTLIRRMGPATPQGMIQIAEGTARLMAAPDGPRISALALEGWDTHAVEGGASGRLAQLLGGLDGAVGAFQAGLGADWSKTVVMVVTEFGRTARVNGTDGTDHGTGTVALLAGGAVKGGRVIADWPGLAANRLLDGRDLQPTTDLRSVTMGIIQDLFDVPSSLLVQKIFPGSEGLKPMKGLLA